MLRLETDHRRIRAGVRLPGSKSISNRLLILCEVLQVSPEIHNLSTSDDTRLLQQALGLIRSGSGATLDIGQAGSDMRFLTALLAGRPGTWILTGSERMKERSVEELVSALRMLGAHITYLEREGYPPLRIEGTLLSGSEVSIRADVSSQFISALLLIAPTLSEGLTIHLEGEIVSRPYIRMTLGLLEKFGFRNLEQERRIQVFPRVRRRSVASFEVESDWSAASYYYSICALAKDCSLELSRLDKKSLQADAVVANLFEPLGVKTVYRENSVLLTKTPEKAAYFEYDFSACPDIAQTLAAACFGLGVKASLSGLQTLRIKETDRIEALRQELTKLGAKVQASDRELHFEKDGPGAAAEPVIETYNDHRMAMSFAPLVQCYPRLYMSNHEVVSKSYPEFWDHFASLGFNLNLQP